MEDLRRAAFTSVGRACRFAALGIFCVVFSFLYDPPLAAFAGGVMFLGLAGILQVCGLYAKVKPYNRTETWLMLRDEHRPPRATAQRLISGVLVDAYAWFRRQALGFAGILLAASLALDVLGLDALPIIGPRPGAQPMALPAEILHTDPVLDALLLDKSRLYP